MPKLKSETGGKPPLSKYQLKREGRGTKTKVPAPVSVASAPSYFQVPNGYCSGTVDSFSRWGGYGFIRRDEAPQKINNAYFNNDTLQPSVLESMRVGKKVVFKLRFGKEKHPTAIDIAFLSD